MASGFYCSEPLVMGTSSTTTELSWQAQILGPSLAKALASQKSTTTRTTPHQGCWPSVARICQIGRKRGTMHIPQWRRRPPTTYCGLSLPKESDIGDELIICLYRPGLLISLGRVVAIGGGKCPYVCMSVGVEQGRHNQKQLHLPDKQFDSEVSLWWVRGTSTFLPWDGDHVHPETESVQIRTCEHESSMFRTRMLRVGCVESDRTQHAKLSLWASLLTRYEQLGVGH